MNWLQRIPEGVWWWASAISLAMMVASLVILRIIILRLPVDYFTGHAAKRAFENGPRQRSLGAILLKNVGGALVILLGIFMLVSPGQGIVTILMGICLVDFPGKRKIELMLIRRPAVHRSLNWMRRRGGTPPLEIPRKARRDE